MEGRAVKFGRRDGNHAEIKKALEDCGCSVWDTADIGGGFPDLVVGRHGRTYLVEVKTLKGKEKPNQREARAAWRGSWHVVRTIEEACRAVGIA